tara:strand:- start:1359 stop:1538 length:180 start_codon:yes stop_codon:yes gene_type:complete
MTEATINFQNRDQAQEFATRWAFKSLTGYSISKSTVKIYNITDDLKLWIDGYVQKLNQE